MNYLFAGIILAGFVLIGLGTLRGASTAERKLEDLQAGIDTNNNGEKE